MVCASLTAHLRIAPTRTHWQKWGDAALGFLAGWGAQAGENRHVRQGASPFGNPSVPRPREAKV